MTQPPDRELAVFSAARRLPTGERSAYLDETCAGDAALRERVEQLLEASEEAGAAFLEDPGHRAERCRGGAVPPDPGVTSRISPPPAEKPGDRIGRYKLLQQIGEGGCGVVYMAEQEEPIRRRVALKVIKLGMDTKSVIARFEAERQALAMMDHPSIARVFDAGASDTGRPYFVMELVRGIKITEFCDQKQLSTRQRLDLFVQVCRAIQHAHQKGIIHRDIKPSNILVTLRDGVPVPKVIDFGIAKATTDQRLTDKTLFTEFEMFIGTPAYMSPEQAEMSELGIDTRSDIYSLGILLYELLTGATPFDTRELMKAGLMEIRRIIREEEPARPSTRLTTMAAAVLTEVANHRQSDPAKLSSLIRGDLDWIVMKALEKDRARRYETVNGLAMDVERYLKTEPVEARPPSRVYQFQKLVRRNKLAFAAAGAVLAALVIGLGLSTWQFIEKSKAEREQSRLRQAAQQEQANQAKLRQKAEADEKKAQTEASKSQQVADFLKKMLEGVGPSAALGRDTTMLREVLERTTDQLSTGLTNQPEVEAELRTTIGEVYEALGEADKSGEMHRRALELRRKALGSGALEVAESLNHLALELHHQSKLEESDAALQEALKIERNLLYKEHPLIATSLDRLAYVRLWQDRLEESENLFREALAMRRKLYGNEHLKVADNLNNLAVAITARGRLDEAESMLHESLAMQRRLVKQDDDDTAMMLYNMADALQRGERLEEAAVAFRESLAIRRRILGDKHVVVTTTINRLDAVLAEMASRLDDEGKFAQAESLARERLAILEKQSPDAWQTFNTLTMLGGSLLAQGKLSDAEPLLLSGYEGMKQREQQMPTNALVRLVEAKERLVRFYETSGQAEKAAKWKERKVMAQPAGLSATEAATRRASGFSHAQHGAFAEAVADFARVIELCPSDYEVWHWQAAALVQSGQFDAYHELRHKSLKLFEHLTDPNTAERIAKDYLMLPSAPEAELETAARMADMAVSTAPTNHPDIAWFQFCKGLAEYRQEHFVGAVDWMQKVLSRASDDPVRDVEVCMVLAMAQYRSKEAGEAGNALAKGLEIAEKKLPKLDSGDLGNWIDWIVAQALMGEARALIEGGSKSE